VAGALASLAAEVLARGRCALCGACLGLCPYLVAFRGRVVALHECDLETGRCAACCPRLAGPAPLRAEDDAPRDPDLGPVRRAVAARAADAGVRAGGQSGGAVSALVLHALATGRAGRALLTARGPDLEAAGRLAATRAEVLACAGSGLAAGPTLAALNADGATDPVAAVALPCQAAALAHMRAAGTAAGRRVAVVIGLFCTWAFDAGRLRAFLAARLGGAAPARLEVTPPPARALVVHTGAGAHALPLDDARPCIRAACAACGDLTAAAADVSVGTVEGRPGWSLVLARSAAGAALVADAVAAGALETAAAPADGLAHLRAAAGAKRRRAERAP
jgi:coenzyme F420 hydrogenase subunit beta